MKTQEPVVFFILSWLLHSNPLAHIALVSGYNENFNIFNISGGGHTIELISKPEVPSDLSWLHVAPDKGHVYAIHESSGYVSRLKLSSDYTKVETLESVKLPGSGPAHLLVDTEKKEAFSANYGSGTWTQLSLRDDGGLGDIVRHETFPQDKTRNCTSHPHQTVARGGWVWVVDLGCDSIYTMSPDLDRPSYWWHLGLGVRQWGRTEVSPGCGPRHMVLHPRLDLGAVVCELQSLVQLYSINMKDGSLRLVQELPLSSEAGDYGAEITFDETGDTLYASSRGTGVIIVYRLNSSSSPPTLERIQEISQSGSWPRHFVLQDRLLVTTDQKGDSLQVLHVEPSTGLLIPGKIAATEHSPAFVTFIN